MQGYCAVGKRETFFAKIKFGKVRIPAEINCGAIEPLRKIEQLFFFVYGSIEIQPAYNFGRFGHPFVSGLILLRLVDVRPPAKPLAFGVGGGIYDFFNRRKVSAVETRNPQNSVNLVKIALREILV